RAGRPKIGRELRELIRRMSKENPNWGASRIHGELLMLGFEVAQSTVSKYMVQGGSPSQGWKTFFRNHPRTSRKFSPPMRRTAMRSGGTWHWAKTRPWVGRCSGAVLLSPSRSCPDCTTITSGYNFRKGQVVCCK